MNIIDQLGKGRKRWLFAAVDVIFPLLVVLAVDLIAIPFSELGAFIADRWYITLIGGGRRDAGRTATVVCGQERPH